jgi:hypothetical protein
MASVAGVGISGPGVCGRLAFRERVARANGRGRHGENRTRHFAGEGVQEKREAALTRANTVTAATGMKWSYLLAAERDLKDASGSWSRLHKATGV